MNYTQQLQTDGGFTAYPSDREGMTPTTGYYVSLRDLTTKVAIDVFADVAVSLYVESVSDLIDWSDPTYFVGGWLSEGTVYLDVTEHVEDLDRALALGISRNQISIWDIANAREISTGGTGE
jgi:hypothetical protein